MKKFIANNIWWVTFILALLLLVSHTLSIDKVKVDNTTIILLLVLLTCPFISAIKRIKFGDFEAEIDPKEVRRIKEDVEAKMAERAGIDEPPPSPVIVSTIDTISKLSEEDPVLALAKLRMEIEKVINKLYQRVALQGKQKRVFSLSRMIIELSKSGLIAPDISHPMREVVSICNRAIHGEEIRPQDAESIINTGSYLLEMLYWLSKSIIHEEEPESTIIDQSVVEGYHQARYKLTTVIPYAGDTQPVQNVRILSQEGLDAFFEGYEDFAEFIVDLRKIENVSAQQ
jgi:hypothetical protein